MFTNSCLGGIMASLIFLEGLEEEALVEFMVELFEEDEDGKKNEKDGLFNLKANDRSPFTISIIIIIIVKMRRGWLVKGERRRSRSDDLSRVMNPFLCFALVFPGGFLLLKSGQEDS
ncbi:hypothetical protein Tco_1404317 [Tanacetum coccineum]